MLHWPRAAHPQGGSMLERMGVNGSAFPDCTAALIVADVLSALRYIHRSGLWM